MVCKCKDDKPNTFYGAGKADPLRFGRKKLHKWFLYFWMFADQYDAKLYNFGEVCLGVDKAEKRSRR